MKTLLNQKSSAGLSAQTLSVSKLSKSLVAAGALSLIIAPAAVAKKYRHDYQNSAYDTAKVIDAQPIFETYQVNHPIEQCYNERVPVRDDYRYRRTKTKTPEILGAILGGVIGNQVGKRGGGNARDVATVAGAVLGGSIGRDVKYNNARKYRRGSLGYEVVERCELRDNYVTKQKLVAYDVAYKYRGNVFHTQMDKHPGSKIRVKVTVDPV